MDKTDSYLTLNKLSPSLSTVASESASTDDKIIEILCEESSSFEDRQACSECKDWYLKNISVLVAAFIDRWPESHSKKHFSFKPCYQRFVTVCDAWIYYYSTKSKQQSKQWDEAGESATKKCKTVSISGKTLGILVVCSWRHNVNIIRPRKKVFFTTNCIRSSYCRWTLRNAFRKPYTFPIVSWLSSERLFFVHQSKELAFLKKIAWIKTSQLRQTTTMSNLSSNCILKVKQAKKCMDSMRLRVFIRRKL